MKLPRANMWCFLDLASSPGAVEQALVVISAADVKSSTFLVGGVLCVCKAWDVVGRYLEVYSVMDS